MINKFAPTVTLLVKGVTTLDARTGKLPAGTVCLKTVTLPGTRVLPPGTAVVQAVTLKAFGGLVFQPVEVGQNGSLPEGCVVVDTVSLRTRGVMKQRAIEAIKVLEGNLFQPIGKTGIRLPQVPPVIGIPKRGGRKLGIRVPVVPPKIKPKR